MVEKKKEKLNLAQYGSIVFSVGVLIAIFAGLFTSMNPTASKIVVATLILVGLFVGAMNVSGGESVSFLVAGIVIVISGGAFLGAFNSVFFANWPEGGKVLLAMYQNIVVMVVPAAFIVAFKAIFATAKDN